MNPHSNLKPNLVFFGGDTNDLVSQFAHKPINYYQLPLNNGNLQLICVAILIILFCCFCYNSSSVKKDPVVIQPDIPQPPPTENHQQEYMNGNINSNEIEYFAQNNNNVMSPDRIQVPEHIINHEKEQHHPEMGQQVNDTIKNDRLEQSMDIYPNRHLAEVQYPTTNYNNQINQASINPKDLIQLNQSQDSVKELTYSQMESLREEQDNLIKNNLQHKPDPSYTIKQQHTNKKDLKNDSHYTSNRSDSPIDQIQTEVTNENSFNDMGSFQSAETSMSFSFI